MIIESLVPWRARPNFRLDATSAALSGVYSGGIFPFVAFVARDHLHASAAELGLMTAAPFVGNLLALPFTHIVSRGQPVRNVALIIAIARVILVGASFATGSAVFAWTVFAVQCLASIPTPTYISIIRLIYPLEYLGRLLSYTRVLQAAGMIFSTFSAGWMIDRWGWRPVFLAFAPVGLAALALYSRIRIPADQPVTRHNEMIEFTKGAFSLLRQDIPFRWFALAVSVYGFGNLMAVPVYTIYQVDVLHITASWVAILMNITQVVWMLSYVFWARYIDSVSPLKLVMINTALAAIMPLNYLVAFEVWMLVPFAVVGGIVNAGIELSYFNSVMHFSTPENSAQYQAMHSLLLGVRGIIGPFAGAAMARSLIVSGGDIRWVFAASGVLILAGAVLQRLGMRHPVKRSGGWRSEREPERRQEDTTESD